MHDYAIQYELKEEKNMANATYEVQASQFNIDRTYAGRWTITFNNPPINMFVPTTIVELGALMTDLEADRLVKVVMFESVRIPRDGEQRFHGIVNTDSTAT